MAVCAGQQMSVIFFSSFWHVGGRSISLWVLLLTCAALSGAHFLRAQIGSVIVRFVEVIHLLFAFLVEILKTVQHRVCLFLVIRTCRRTNSYLYYYYRT